MDPYAALKNLDEAIHANPCDREAVYEATEALIGWLRGGGFLPFNTEVDDWRQKLTRTEFITYLWHLSIVSQPQEVTCS